MRLDQLIRSSGIFDHELIVQDAERRQLFVERCAGRSVLHVGCCDVPLFNADDNLHLFLARHTEHLDGLDVSEEGIAVLRRYVKGDFFVDPSTVTKEYEVLLAPEVLEHTPNPSEFLKGIFSIRARQYIITAPHYQWFEQARRNGNVFHERVHSDHKAWYSPYTLLNAVRPFIDEARDDVELFLLTGTGSVAVVVTTPLVPKPFPPQNTARGLDADAALAAVAAHVAAGDVPTAFHVIREARAVSDDARLVNVQLRLLIDTGQHTEALRQGLDWMRRHPGDADCLDLCADAVEALGDTTRAGQWRAAARARRG